MKQFLIALITAFLMMGMVTIDAEDFGPRCITLMDDDGQADFGWSMLSNPDSILRKTLNLDFSPMFIEKAVLEYQIACEPYDPKLKLHIINQNAAKIKWANLVVRINGHTILDQPAGPYISKGLHHITVPVKLLKEGENKVDFKWKPLSPENPENKQYGYIYFAVDILRKTPCQSFKSNDLGRTFKPDPRTKGQREYLIRIRLKINEPQPEEQSQDRNI